MILGDKDTGCSLNQTGAYLEELWINGSTIIRKSPDGHVTHGGAAVLFPFGNRIKNAVYSYNSMEYHLPENDGKNSIHGLVRDVLFNYIHGKNYIEFYTYFTNNSYPGNAEISIRYEIKGKEFKTIFTVKSVSGSIPVEIGFHPYFRVTGKYSIDYSGNAMELEYKDEYFPDGRYRPVDLRKADLRTSKFDNAYLIDSDISIKDENHEILIRRENMPYTVIYNGEYAGNDAVAVEPMTGAPDVYHNGMGLITLEEEETFMCSYSVSLLEQFI